MANSLDVSIDQQLEDERIRREALERNAQKAAERAGGMNPAPATPPVTLVRNDGETFTGAPARAQMQALGIPEQTAQAPRPPDRVVPGVQEFNPMAGRFEQARRIAPLQGEANPFSALRQGMAQDKAERERAGIGVTMQTAQKARQQDARQAYLDRLMAAETERAKYGAEAMAAAKVIPATIAADAVAKKAETAAAAAKDVQGLKNEAGAAANETKLKVAGIQSEADKAVADKALAGTRYRADSYVQVTQMQGDTAKQIAEAKNQIDSLTHNGGVVLPNGKVWVRSGSSLIDGETGGIVWDGRSQDSLKSLLATTLGGGADPAGGGWPYQQAPAAGAEGAPAASAAPAAPAAPAGATPAAGATAAASKYPVGTKGTFKGKPATWDGVKWVFI